MTVFDRASSRARLPLATSLMALTAFSALPAHAQEAAPASGGVVLEEIIVTANRRAERLSRVPASIAAFSQEKMDSQGVRQIEDITRLTPGLNFSRQSYFSGSNTNISIRGIQSNDGAATTGIYIDDVPIQVRSLGFSSANVYPKVFDLERVEVLRGPQGTLFGAGAEGGAVRFITGQPDLENTHIYGRSELAFTEKGDPSYEAGVSVSTPVQTGKLAFRGSAWYRRDGGWVDRTNPENGTIADKNANAQDSKAAKLALTWAPTDSLRITPGIYYQDIDIDDTTGYWESLSNPSKGEFRTGYALSQPQHDRYYLPSLTINADFGAVELTSVTAYFDRDQEEMRDYTNFVSEIVGAGPYVTLPGQNAPGYFSEKQNNFSQELRLQSAPGDSPWTWVVGGFYSHEKQQSAQANQDSYVDTLIRNATGGAFNAASWYGVPLLPGDFLYDSRTRSKTEQIAGFGQVDYALTDKLKVTAGVRVAHLKINHEQAAEGPWAGGTLASDGSTSETPVTPKFGLTYQYDPDVMFYATASKGFRAGGAQTAVPTSFCGADLQSLGLQSSPTSYDSDSVWSYEAGTKSYLFNGRVMAEASGYYIEWKDVQRSVWLPTCGSSFINNAGSITSKGFDLSVQGKVTDDVTLGVVLGYTDATFDQTVLGGAGAILAEKGDAAFDGPKFTMTVTGQYDFVLAGNTDAYARFDYTYSSKGPRDNPAVYSYDPVLTNVPSISQVNLRAGVKLEAVDLSVFVNNLTDTHPALGRFHHFAGSPLTTNSTLRPRTFGLTGTYRY